VTDPAEKTVLVLQGGGALGAYQAGAYAALAEAGQMPSWVAGISIGSVNAAIIAGNPAEKRVGRLREFWERVSSWLIGRPLRQFAADLQ
jgi:NTE family protein